MKRDREGTGAWVGVGQGEVDGRLSHQPENNAAELRGLVDHCATAGRGHEMDVRFGRAGRESATARLPHAARPDCYLGERVQR